jgi:hypothetical protein
MFFMSTFLNADASSTLEETKPQVKSAMIAKPSDPVSREVPADSKAATSNSLEVEVAVDEGLSKIEMFDYELVIYRQTILSRSGS